MDAENQILVIAEHDGSELDPITHDLIGWGVQIAVQKQLRLGVLVLGSEISPIVDALRKSPIDTIYAIDDKVLQHYNADLYVQVIAAALKCRPRLIFSGYTYFGIEVSGGLASKLDADLWSNCVAIKATPIGYSITRPISKGTYVATLEIEGEVCTLITLQRGSSSIAVGAPNWDHLKLK